MAVYEIRQLRIENGTETQRPVIEVTINEVDPDTLEVLNTEVKTVTGRDAATLMSTPIGRSVGANASLADLMRAAVRFVENGYTDMGDMPGEIELRVTDIAGNHLDNITVRLETKIGNEIYTKTGLTSPAKIEAPFAVQAKIYVSAPGYRQHQGVINLSGTLNRPVFRLTPEASQ